MPNCDLYLIENKSNRFKENHVLIKNHILIKNQCIIDINGDKVPFCLYYKDNKCSQCEDSYIL